MASCLDIQPIIRKGHSSIRLPICDWVTCFTELHQTHSTKGNIVVVNLGLAQRFLECTGCIICACGHDTRQPNNQELCPASRHVCYGTGKLETPGLWGSGLNQTSCWWFGWGNETHTFESQDLSWKSSRVFWEGQRQPLSLQRVRWVRLPL